MKTCSGLLLLIFCLVGAAQPAGVNIPLADSPPVVDGSPEDAAWQDIDWLGDFTDYHDSSLEAEVQTEFKAVHDGRFLYIIIRADEPAMENLRLVSRDVRNASLWQDDSVEIFIDPGRSEERYYHFVINHNGTIYDALCEVGIVVAMDSGVDIFVEAVVEKGEDYWTVEIALPLAELELTPEAEGAWGINIARNRYAGGEHELSSFAPMEEGFHQPDKFASAELKDLDVNPYLWFVGRPSDESLRMEEGRLVYNFTLPVRNLTGRFQLMRLNAELIGPSGEKSGAGEDLRIPPEREQRVSMSVPVPEEGENTLEITLARRVMPDVALRVKRELRSLDYVPMSVEFTVPFYRDNIYATQDVPEVEVRTVLELPEEEIEGGILALELRDAEGDVLYSGAEMRDPGAVSLVRLDASGLPEGEHAVTALFKDGGGREHRARRTLRKLPYREGEVWIDENEVTHVGGEPFLPVGWFSGPREKSDGYNVAQRYYSFSSEAYLKSWLDNAYENDTMVMIYPYQEFLSGGRREVFASEKMKQELTREQEVKIRHLVEKFGDHPALLAWYMADEPEGRDHSPGWYKSVYELLREIDPYRPCVMLNYGIRGMRKYYESCDILMPDCYPAFKKDMPAQKPLSEQGRYVDEGRKLRPMWFVPQAFDWSIWSSKAHYLPSHAISRIGRQENSRGPTFRELRAQAYQVISHGAMGLVWYSHASTHYYFNLHQKIGMPYLSEEIFALQRAILSPDVKGRVSVSPEDSITACSLREVDGEIYIFAVNTSLEPVEAEFSVGDFGGRSLHVVSEDRSVRVSRGSFRDKFGAYDTRIYTTDPSLRGLTAVEEIEAEIAEAEACRRKPGNILFDNPGIEISASSDRWNYAVVDGLTEDRGQLYWGAAPPCWIEIALPEAERISRIAVYSPNLRDFSLQVDEGEGWVTVKEVKGSEPGRTEAVFPSREAKGIRLHITRVEGSRAVVKEIEAYR